MYYWINTKSSLKVMFSKNSFHIFEWRVWGGQKLRTALTASWEWRDSEGFLRPAFEPGKQSFEINYEQRIENKIRNTCAVPLEHIQFLNWNLPKTFILRLLENHHVAALSRCLVMNIMWSYQWRSQGEGGSFTPPRNPGKFAKDGEQPRPRPAIRINCSRKL